MLALYENPRAGTRRVTHELITVLGVYIDPDSPGIYPNVYYLVATDKSNSATFTGLEAASTIDLYVGQAG